MITYRQLAAELAKHPFPDEAIGTVERRAPLENSLDNTANMALNMGGTMLLLYKSRGGEFQFIQFTNTN